MAQIPVLVCATNLPDFSSLNSCAKADRIFVNYELDALGAVSQMPTVSELTNYFGAGFVIPLTFFVMTWGLGELLRAIRTF